ncbi:hypothetical protein BSKO_03021 [Bryopsis sp. KO-2023]|nr:hypothetical protein BSKO_03021 [Bryopsis sp. KO-2023]
MGGLKKWVQATCRSSVKAFPCGKSCFGIMRPPMAQPQEEETEGTAEGEFRTKLDFSFTMHPCSKCEEPIGDDPSPLHCPAPAEHHNFSLDCCVQGSVIFPLEIPEMEFHDSQSETDENENGCQTLFYDVHCMMYDPETPMRSALSWPAPKHRDSINLPEQVSDGRRQLLSEQAVGCGLTIDSLQPINQLDSPPGLYSLPIPEGGYDNYDNEKENVKKGGNGGGIDGWGGEPRGLIQGQGAKYGVPKLMLSPGKGSSILSSYEPHSVRDNSAYESSGESWRSSSEDGHETVSRLQVALYKKSIGNSLVGRLPGGVNSSEPCLPTRDGGSDGGERLVGNVFHQLFQVEGVGINDQGVVWDRSSCESWDTDSRQKATTSGRQSQSKSSWSVSTRRGSSFFNAPWSRTKSGSTKNSSLFQNRSDTWIDRSINWITCGKASFSREVDNFVKHPRENIHRQANAARGAARYQKRQKVLVNRIEVALKEGQTDRNENQGGRNRSESNEGGGSNNNRGVQQSCSEIDSAAREGMLWPKLRRKLFFVDHPQRTARDSFMGGGPSCHSPKASTGNEMHQKKIGVPLTVSK